MKQSQKGISWLDLILAIPAGTKDEFPLKNASTIKPLISSRVKDKHPERVYRTDATSKIDTLIVIREK